MRAWRTRRCTNSSTCRSSSRRSPPISTRKEQSPSTTLPLKKQRYYIHCLPSLFASFSPTVSHYLPTSVSLFTLSPLSLAISPFFLTLSSLSPFLLLARLLFTLPYYRPILPFLPSIPLAQSLFSPCFSPNIPLSHAVSSLFISSSCV